MTGGRVFPDGGRPDDDRTDRPTGGGSRTATVRTRHDEPALVAGALAPDDTASMSTRVDGDTIACTVERPTMGGLRSTVDDYVVNLRVADRLIERARDHRSRPRPDSEARSESPDGGRPRPADERRSRQSGAAGTRQTESDTDT